MEKLNKFTILIGKIFGIGIILHWSFTLLYLFAIFISLINNNPIIIVNINLIFITVLIHEISHCLMARHRGFRMNDILMLPIGGLAIGLDDFTKNAKDEFLITIVGPLSNAIMGLAFLSMNCVFPNELFYFLTLINIIMCLFNLLPCYPMDGGRILRCLLKIKYNHTKATKISSAISQAMCFPMGLFGIFLGSPGLVVISICLYLSNKTNK